MTIQNCTVVYYTIVELDRLPQRDHDFDSDAYVVA